MSNEYEDWSRDEAADYLLNNNLVERIEYCEPMHYGYIAIGQELDETRHIFFVWNDDLDGWSYREIYI